ncbi:MAG TPA: hypothetical protein VEZ44_09120 [bacterium]|nr:hypothetical protein [bacterium]
MVRSCTIKPLGVSILAAAETRGIVTVDEHSLGDAAQRVMAP